MNPHVQAITRRILQAVVTILGIVAVNFVVLNFAPGDMAEVMAGQAGGAGAGYIEQVRAQFGLDQPLIVRFWNYFANLVQFDLGYAFSRNLPVSTVLLERLPATLLLMGSAIALAFLIGISLGSIAARRANSLTDTIISAISLIGYATPLFWLGLMMVLLFTIKLGWLPSSGMRTIGSRASGWSAFLDLLRHAAMPTVTLALFYIAVFTRLMRASILQVSNLDFVTTARAKGASEGRIYSKHVFGNAVLPVVTMLGVQVGGMLGGSVVVETIFSWPGLGRLTFDAIFSRDVNLLLGILFLSSLFVVIVNLAVDLLYSWLDPRIEFAS
jgi:peptide/nickel transport system permease protein